MRIDEGTATLLRRLRGGATLSREGTEGDEGRWTIRDRRGAPSVLARGYCEEMVRQGLLRCEDDSRARWYPRIFVLTGPGLALADGLPPPGQPATGGGSAAAGAPDPRDEGKSPVELAAEALVAAYDACDAGGPEPGGVTLRERFLCLARAVRAQGGGAGGLDERELKRRVEDAFREARRRASATPEGAHASGFGPR